MEGPMISRRRFLSGALATGFAAAAGSSALRGVRAFARPPEPPSSPPNLVFVFPDQMRGQAMGFLGGEPVRTPVLDRFARESVVFTQAAVNYPICSPYRAMLWSGKYPFRNGVTENLTSEAGRRGLEFRAGERCLSDVLKDKGYSLGYIGKWHLDAPRKPYIDCSNNRAEPAWNEWTPPERRHGFDFWLAYGTYDQHLRPMYWSTDAPRDGFAYVDQWGPEHEADLAARYIRNEGGRYRDPRKPFALVVSMNPPHMPYDQVPRRYLDMYGTVPLEDLVRRPNIPAAGTRWGDYYRNNIRGYYAMITGVDEQFGRILAVLEESGLTEETIVVFTSDHGNCLGLHDEISKNNPYEESMRVPLLVRWQGRIRPRREGALISVPDMMPTLLGLMGFGADIPRGVEGTDFSWLFRTGKGNRPSSQLYLRVPVNDPKAGARGVRTDRYTFVLRRAEGRDPQTVLFDNEADPYQMNDIAGREPGLAKRLLAEELRPWLERTGDPWRS